MTAAHIEDVAPKQMRGVRRAVLAEHGTAGELLARLRTLTGGYAVHVDACAGYRALYAGLAELEADTNLGVHKENNVLFPAVLVIERGLAGGAL